jgi:TrmH family RNA methyltransferase
MEKEITSPNNSSIKDLVRLKQKSNSIKERKYLIEGENVIKMAIEANVVETIFYTENDYGFENSIKVTNPIIKKLSSLSTSQQAVALCNVKEVDIKNNKRIVILDNINTPNNIGAVIRSALAFNYDGVVVSKDSAYIYNAKCISGSQGAIFKIPVIQTDIIKYIEDNKIDPIVTTLSPKSIDIDSIKAEGNMAFVFGSEAHGVSKEVEKLSSKHLKISIDNIDSLNIAVAAGIVLNKFKK